LAVLLGPTARGAVVVVDLGLQVVANPVFEIEATSVGAVTIRMFVPMQARVEGRTELTSLSILA